MAETDLLDQISDFHDDSWGWAMNCCGGNPDEAGDVLQAAYTKAAQGRLAHAGRSSLKTWWFGVVRLTALEGRRKAARRRGLAGLAALHWREWFGQASASAEQDDSTLLLHAALKSLSTRQREVLHLVFYQDLTIEEASAVMGVSLGSARTHYQRGKQRLRTLIDPQPTGHAHAH